MEDMNAALWSGLRPEIVERALSYLSTPVLCRFRTVCKRWNSLISNPVEFGALCTQNATRDVAPYSFVAVSYIGDEYIIESGIVRKRRHAWAFLDMKAKRWYTIKATRTHEHLFDAFGSWLDYETCVAIDGGLVCRLLPDEEDENGSMLVISNPFAQMESRILPVPTPKHRMKYSSVMVDMVVDVNTGCYTIFVLGRDNWKRSSKEKPVMVIYESRTDAWRSSSLPVIRTRRIRTMYVQDRVCFKGLLYVLVSADFDDGSPLARSGHSLLWSYNHVEDHWKDTGVVIRVCPVYLETKFLVSDNGLFLSQWVHVSGNVWMYQLSEIDLQERTLRMVLRETEATMMELFEVSEVMMYPPTDMLLHGFGLGKVIVLVCRNTRMTRVYDLRTCTWDALRENPLGLPIMPNFEYEICLGKPLNLVVPSASESWT